METPKLSSEVSVPDRPPTADVPRRTSTLLLELFAVFLLLLAMSAGYSLNLAENGNIAEASGAAMAPAIIVLVVFLIFRFFGKAKTRRSRATIACWTLGLSGLGLSEQLRQEQQQKAQQQSVSYVERTGLAIDGNVIRHRTLGFQLPYPGAGFQFNADIQATAAKQISNEPGMTAWALANETRTDIVFVQVLKDFKMTQSYFDRFASGMRGELGRGERRVLVDSMRWSGAVHDYRIAAVTADGIYIQARCLPSNISGQAGFIVCVMTIAHDRSSLESVREGLRLTNP